MFEWNWIDDDDDDGGDGDGDGDLECVEWRFDDRADPGIAAMESIGQDNISLPNILNQGWNILFITTTSTWYLVDLLIDLFEWV